MKKDNVKLGLTVKCKDKIEAYYSNYGGNRTCFFTPEDIGIVGAIDVPKVSTNGSFVCVDFEKYGQKWRVALDYNNIVLV